MEKLKQNDSFTGGSKKQYTEIVSICYDKNIHNFIVDNCITRGGLFYSERTETVIAGKLKGSNKLNFEDFLVKLKNTVGEKITLQHGNK